MLFCENARSRGVLYKIPLEIPIEDFRRRVSLSNFFLILRVLVDPHNSRF